jgi:ABC-type nitrate/sulfonate/bicarbonate transport system substrate-binding protein
MVSFSDMVALNAHVLAGHFDMAAMFICMVAVLKAADGPAALVTFRTVLAAAATHAFDSTAEDS